jgi:hypothetical protein
VSENLTDKLFLELLVNTQLSPKAKERLSKPESYFQIKQEVESKYIGTTGFYDFFKNASLDEIRGMSIDNQAPNFRNEAVLLEILINTLMRFVDDEKTLSEKAILINEKYQTLKTHFPFLPQDGNSLKEYMSFKGQREEVENTRVSGSICPSCLGHNIRSKGKEWQCRSCGKRFRKH